MKKSCLSLRRPLRSSQKGFTLLELMISTALLLMVMGVTLNFIFDFSRSGNRTIIRATLDEQLRNSATRLEREVMDASAVLVDDGGSITTDKSTLVLSVPLYNSLGFVVVDPANANLPLFDTLVVSVKQDNSADDLTLRPTGSAAVRKKPNKLVFSLTPSTVGDTTRQAISNQVIARDLMPTSGDFYLTGENATTSDVAFNYLDKDGNVTATPADIAQIQVLLKAGKDYYGGIIIVEKEVLIRLRNWG